MSSSTKYINGSRHSINSARRLSVNEEDNLKNRLINRARLNMQNRRSYNYKYSDKFYNVWGCIKTKKGF